VASLLLLDVAATPPPAEEGSRLLQLSKRSGNLDSRAVQEVNFLQYGAAFLHNNLRQEET